MIIDGGGPSREIARLRWAWIVTCGFFNAIMDTLDGLKTRRRWHKLNSLSDSLP
jgi:hypothetical protein